MHPKTGMNTTEAIDDIFYDFYDFVSQSKGNSNAPEILWFHLKIRTKSPPPPPPRPVRRGVRRGRPVGRNIIFITVLT